MEDKELDVSTVTADGLLSQKKVWLALLERRPSAVRVEPDKIDSGIRGAS
jgi:hypothetical protein